MITLGSIDSGLSEVAFLFEMRKNQQVMPKAIEAKLDSIERNETWELVSRPKKHKTIELGVKWVYQTKYKLESSLDKHKGVGCPNVLGHYLAGHPFSLFPHFRGHEQVGHLCTKPINRLPPASLLR